MLEVICAVSRLPQTPHAPFSREVQFVRKLTQVEGLGFEGFVVPADHCVNAQVLLVEPHGRDAIFIVEDSSDVIIALEVHRCVCAATRSSGSKEIRAVSMPNQGCC